uniref:Cytochrome c biogenesis protein Ccs1 n=1 Tax=Periphykon beckeri TaxID=2006982 RepID=A0A1Z1M340_9FLOR|nr:cytochrome c biogenesis protein ccs1 [Periphykon beckeri]ARW60332.1 cytochrome c biogenesis protein ccs1 [Periphykon beckeri]
MNKNFIWRFVKKLANLNFSIFVLSLIAFFCICGSIIEQDKSLSYYQINYPHYYLFILFLGFDHIFRTFYFALILIVFILSLITCTFSTQLPSLRNARRWKFLYSSCISKTSDYLLKNDSNSKYFFTSIVYSLMRINFFVFYKNNSLYSYKGLYGRVAPIFVHFSIIAVLLGSIVSFLFSFVVQEIVPQGEVFHLKNIINAGFYSYLPDDLVFRVDNFYINYNTNGSVKQFFSSLSLYIHNYIILHEQLIYVNKPLRFFSVTLYQTDWQIDVARINCGVNSNIQKKFFKVNINGQNCWLLNIPISKDNNIFFVVFNLDNNVLVCSSSGLILQEVNLTEKFYINNIAFTINSIVPSTGLQIKVDPGIVLVYFGFFIMIFSTFTSYISYSQVWIYINVKSLSFMGSTNRALLFFEQDMIYLNNIYSYHLLSRFKRINTLLV